MQPETNEFFRDTKALAGQPPNPSESNVALAETIKREIEKALANPLALSGKDDPVLLTKLKPLMRPNEPTINSFIARVQIGPNELRSMTIEQIADVIHAAETRSKHEFRDPATYRVNAIPKKFSMY